MGFQIKRYFVYFTFMLMLSFSIQPVGGICDEEGWDCIPSEQYVNYDVFSAGTIQEESVMETICGPVPEDGRSTQLMMWIRNMSDDIVIGSQVDPVAWASWAQPEMDVRWVGGGDYACIDSSTGTLVSECYEDGYYDVFMKLISECPEISTIHQLRKYEFYYVNPDEPLSMNDDALMQCSSIVNRNPTNSPRVYISEGPEDGYFGDYVRNDPTNLGEKAALRALYTNNNGPQNCCGDDAPNHDYTNYPDTGISSDYGRLSPADMTPFGPDARGGRYLCGTDRSGRWQWLDSRQLAGQVFTMGHGLYDALSTNQSWVVCDAFEDDCPSKDCQPSTDAGFPEAGVNFEIKTSFWENMGTDHILSNLHTQKVNFRSSISDFVCTEFYSTETFAECVGSEYNEPKNNNRGEYGIALYTGNVMPIVDNFDFSNEWIADDSAASESNTVFSGANNYIVAEGSNSLEMGFDYYTDNSDTLRVYTLGHGIHNWDRYKKCEDVACTNWELYLEFDAYFKRSTDLNLQVKNNQGNVRNLFPRDINIIDFSNDGTELDTWHHIIIPIHDVKDINTDVDNISMILFTMIGTGANVQDRYYARYIDGITLGPNKKVCIDYVRDGRSSQVWENDLDKEPDQVDGLYSTFFTLSACEATIYADYTGTGCCGDDPHEYYEEEAEFINTTILEANGVIVGGCWNSEYVRNNSPFQPVQYSINQRHLQNQTCLKDRCRYPLPPSTYLNDYNFAVDEKLGNQSVVDLLTNIEGGSRYGNFEEKYYEIHFLTQGKRTNDENENLIVENVTKSMLNIDGTFYGCHAHPSLSSIQQTNSHGSKLPSTSIIDDGNNFAQVDSAEALSPTQGYCQVRGDYFCSFYDGWSDENFCNDTNKNGNSITCDYREAIERTAIKESINLLDNGGFERPNVYENFPENWANDVTNPYYWTNATSFSGDHSIVLNGLTDAQYYLYSNFIPVVPGQEYTVSSEILNNCGSAMRLIVYTYDEMKGSVTDSGGVSDTSNSAAWNHMKYTVTIPDDHYFVRIALRGETTSACTIFVDDVMFEKGDNATMFFDSIESYGCCPDTYCWDGFDRVCVENQSDEAAISALNENATGYGYRCLDGEWKQQQRKYRWDKSDSGFCPKSTQCLVDSLGRASHNDDPGEYTTVEFAGHNYLNPQCIETGQWVEDHFCDEGNWTTRTKLIALTLLDFVDNNGIGNFTMVCDDYESTLNDYGYEINGTPLLPYYIGLSYIEGNENCSDASGNKIPCTNNFCVLKYWDVGESEMLSEKIVLGVSLNNYMQHSDYPFNNTLDLESNCYSAMNQKSPNKFGDYYSCALGYAYFNNRTNSIIYSKLTNNLPIGQDSFQDTFVEMLKNPLKVITDFILNVMKSSYSMTNYQDFGYVKKAAHFTKIYIDHHNNKKIFGIVETRPAENFLSISYENFSVDVCNVVRMRGFYKPGVSSSANAIGGTADNPIVDCQPIIDTSTQTIRYVVLSKHPDAYGLWSDLTSKLRVNNDYEVVPSYRAPGDLTIDIPSSPSTTYSAGTYAISFSGSSSAEEVSAFYWDFDTVGNEINGEGWGINISHYFDDVNSSSDVRNITLIMILDNGSFSYMNSRTITLNKLDNSPPFVVSHYPTQSEGVSIHSPVIIEFDEIIEHDDSIITVTGGGPNDTGFEDIDGRTIMTWYRDDAFSYDTSYTVRINGQANYAGTTQSTEYSFVFETEEADSENPYVTMASPSRQSAINPNFDCYFEFSEPISVGLFNGVALGANARLYDNNQKLYVPNQPLCTVTFTDQQSNGGTFTTVYGTVDTIQPNYVSHTPLDGTVINGPGTNLVLTFDETVVLNGGALRIVRAEPTDATPWETYVAAPPGTDLTFSLASLSGVDSTGFYEWEIFDSAIMDLAGNYLSGSGSITGDFYFNDTIAPSSFSGPIGTLGSTATLEVMFNKWIDVTNIDYDIDCAGTTFDETGLAESFDGFANTLHIEQPPGGWPNGITCSLTFDTSTVIDYNGMMVATSIPVYAFAIIDTAEPSLVSFYPSSTNLVYNWNGNLTFNMSENISSGDIYVWHYNGALGNYDTTNLCPPSEFTDDWDGSGFDCAITSTTPGTYWARLESMTDLAGNPMVPPVDIYFTVANTTEAVGATSITLNPASGVAEDSSDTVAFSWTMAGTLTNTYPNTFIGIYSSAYTLPAMPYSAAIAQHEIYTETSFGGYTETLSDAPNLISGSYNSRLWPAEHCLDCDFSNTCHISQLLCRDGQVFFIGNPSDYADDPDLRINGSLPIPPPLTATDLGSSILLQWQQAANAVGYDLDVSYDGGLGWSDLTTIGDPATVQFTTPKPTGATCTSSDNTVLFRIYSNNNGGQYEVSASVPCQADILAGPLPPAFNFTCNSGNPYEIAQDELFLLNVTVDDQDDTGQPITLTVDWGDGSQPSTYNCNDDTPCYIPHTYSDAGVMTLNVDAVVGTYQSYSICYLEVVGPGPYVVFRRSVNGLDSPPEQNYVIGDTLNARVELYNCDDDVQGAIFRRWYEDVDTPGVFVMQTHTKAWSQGNGYLYYDWSEENAGDDIITSDWCLTVQGYYENSTATACGETANNMYNYSFVCGNIAPDMPRTNLPCQAGGSTYSLAAQGGSVDFTNIQFRALDANEDTVDIFVAWDNPFDGTYTQVDNDIASDTWGSTNLKSYTTQGQRVVSIYAEDATGLSSEARECVINIVA